MEIRNAVKENMKNWISDGTKMSAQIDADRGTMPTSTIQNNTSGSKSEVVKPTPKTVNDDLKKTQQPETSKQNSKNDEE